MSILFLILSSIANAIRGGNIINIKAWLKSHGISIPVITHGRLVATYIMGIISGVLFNDYKVGLITAIGYLIWAAPGWGKYFGFHFGSAESINSKEIGWVDTIINFAYTTSQDNGIVTPSNMTDPDKDGYCLLGMTLRGLYLLPMTAGLAWYFSNPWIFCIGYGMMLFGYIYWIWNSLLLKFCVAHNIDCTKNAELSTGFFIGCLLLIIKCLV